MRQTQASRVQESGDDGSPRGASENRAPVTGVVSGGTRSARSSFFLRITAFGELWGSASKSCPLFRIADLREFAHARQSHVPICLAHSQGTAILDSNRPDPSYIGVNLAPYHTKGDFSARKNSSSTLAHANPITALQDSWF